MKFTSGPKLLRVAVPAIVFGVAALGMQAKSNAQPNNTKFIHNAYEDLLLRPAQPSEVTKYLKLMKNGTSRFRVAADIEYEAGHRAQQTRRAYTMFLRRQPTDAERDYGVAFLAKGGRLEHLEAEVVGTPEYYIWQGGGTNASYLNQVCLDFCGHTIKGGDLDKYLGQMNLGKARQAIAREMINTEDSYGMQVDMWYRRHLRRNANWDEWIGHIFDLSAGAREEVVIGNIMATPEYFNLHNP